MKPRGTRSWNGAPTGPLVAATAWTWPHYGPEYFGPAQKLKDVEYWDFWLSSPTRWLREYVLIETFAIEGLRETQKPLALILINMLGNTNLMWHSNFMLIA